MGGGQKGVWRVNLLASWPQGKAFNHPALLDVSGVQLYVRNVLLTNVNKYHVLIVSPP
jgi:hypothetical protein